MFSQILAAAAPVLIDKGVDFLKGTSFGKSVIQAGTSFLGSFGIDSDDLSKFGENLTKGYLNNEGLQREDLPSVGRVSATGVGVSSRLPGASQAPRIPLGSNNTVPNMLNRSNVRYALQRVQTIPVPRPTITGSTATIALSSAKTSQVKLPAVEATTKGVK